MKHLCVMFSRNAEAEINIGAGCQQEATPVGAAPASCRYLSRAGHRQEVALVGGEQARPSTCAGTQLGPVIIRNQRQ